MTILNQQHKEKQQITYSKSLPCCVAPMKAQLLLNNKCDKASKKGLSVNQLIDFYFRKISSADAEICSISSDRKRLTSGGAYTMDELICEASEMRKYLVPDVATAWYRAKRDCGLKEQPKSRQQAIFERLEENFEAPVVQAANFQRISPQFLYLLQQHADMVSATLKPVSLVANQWNFVYQPVKKRKNTSAKSKTVKFINKCEPHEKHPKHFAATAAKSQTKASKTSFGILKQKSSKRVCSSPNNLHFITESELNHCCKVLTVDDDGRSSPTKHKRQGPSSNADLKICCESVMADLLSQTVKSDKDGKDEKNTKANESCEFQTEDIKSKERALDDCEAVSSKGCCKTDESKRQKSGGADVEKRPTNICVKTSLKPIIKVSKPISKQTKKLKYSKPTQVNDDNLGHQPRVTTRKSCATRTPTPYSHHNAKPLLSRESSSSLMREIWRRPKYRIDPSAERFSASKTMRRKKNSENYGRLFAGYDQKNDSLASIVGCKPIVSLHELTKVKLTKTAAKDLGVAGYSDSSIEPKDEKLNSVAKFSDKRATELKQLYPVKKHSRAIKSKRKSNKKFDFDSSATDVRTNSRLQYLYRIHRYSTQHRDLKQRSIYRNDSYLNSVSSNSGHADSEESYSSAACDVVDYKVKRASSKRCHLCKRASQLISECYSALHDFSEYCCGKEFCRGRSPTRKHTFERRSKSVAPRSPQMTIPRRRNSSYDSDENAETVSRCTEPLDDKSVRKRYSTSDLESSEVDACASSRKVQRDKLFTNHCKHHCYMLNKNLINKYYHRFDDFKAHKLKSYQNQKHSQIGKRKLESSTPSTAEFDSKYESTSIESLARRRLRQQNIRRARHRSHKMQELKKSAEAATTPSKSSYEEHAPDFNDDSADNKHNLTQKRHLKKKASENHCTLKPEIEKVTKNMSKGQRKGVNDSVTVKQENTAAKIKNSLKTSDSFKRKISQILQKKMIMVVDASPRCASTPKLPNKQHKKVTINQQINGDDDKKVKVTKKVAKKFNQNKESRKSATGRKQLREATDPNKRKGI